MKSNKLQVALRGRDAVVYEGMAWAVSSTNEIGPFDILPMHANFVGMVRDNVTLTYADGRKKEFKLESGILTVKNDVVEVFMGI